MTALPAALLFGVVPLGGIKKRVMAVLPARLLVPVTCVPRGGLALAELVEALNLVIRPFLGSKAGPNEGGSWPAAHIGCRHGCHERDASCGA